MATLALSAVGAAAGSALLPAGFSFLGATLTGAAIGRAAGSLAGAYIDQALFGSSGQDTVREGPRLADLSVTASTEAADIARLYGRARLGGQRTVLPTGTAIGCNMRASFGAPQTVIRLHAFTTAQLPQTSGATS